MAVALWALSDGKTLSLQLLVGALEGDSGWEILFAAICWVVSVYILGKRKRLSALHIQKTGERNRF